MDNMYYIGHLIDVDGDGWVTEEQAQKICQIMNAQSKNIRYISGNFTSQTVSNDREAAQQTRLHEE